MASEAREEVERYWFRAIVTVMMLGAIAIGAVPVVKSTFFPAPKSQS
jgi:hypothetical protein